MKGKEKCRALKEIRRQIALNNDIEYAVSECTHQGDCKGTCPKCEAEVRYLERELELRRNLGKKVVLAGVGVGVAASLSGCSPVQTVLIDPVVNLFNTGTIEPEAGVIDDPGQQIAGEVDYVDPGPLEGEPSAMPEDDPGSDIYELDGDVEYVPEDSSDRCIEDTSENCSENDSEDASDSSDGFASINPKAEIAGDIQYIP